MKKYFRGVSVLSLGVGIFALMLISILSLLLGAVIPSPSATLLGSALGAMIAIGGAFWVTTWQSVQARKSAVLLVRSHYSPVVESLGDVVEICCGSEGEENLSCDKWRQLKSMIGQFRECYEECEDKLYRVESVFHHLSEEDLKEFFNIERGLNRVFDSVICIENRASHQDMVMYGGPIGAGVREDILCDFEIICESCDALY